MGFYSAFKGLSSTTFLHVALVLCLSRFTPFCFNVSFYHKPLPNLRPLFLVLTPFGRLRSRRLTPTYFIISQENITFYFRLLVQEHTQGLRQGLHLYGSQRNKNGTFLWKPPRCVQELLKQNRVCQKQLNLFINYYQIGNTFGPCRVIIRPSL